MKIQEKVKNMIRSWLNIQPANDNSITILEPMSFQANVIKNQIWYRGDASELHQLYSQLDDGYVGRSRFWAAAPANQSIRKIHSGLPSLIVDTLAYVVKSDLGDVEFKSGTGKSEWNGISKEIDFLSLIGGAVVDTLVSADGAFKISVDTDISEYPMVEFYPANRVEYICKRGYVTGIYFFTEYRVRDKVYQLRETYSKGSVSYALFDGDNEAPINTVPELADLKSVTFSGDYMMAVPLQVFKSPKFIGRGKSLFDTKTDDFDAHDEVVSQWMDALRAGRVQKYIPEDMIPRDPKTGALCSVNSFGTEFVQVNKPPKEGTDSKLEVIQPEIKYEAFLNTYTATLDMCLQGIISPATLGIDVGKMSSADAQREKKDVTGNTRNTITGALEKVIPKLVSAILMTYDNMRGIEPGAYAPSIAFGEYGAPSFDSRIESVGKAATTGIMSTESQVDELWGNSKDDEWKKKEVERINQAKGLAEMSPPGVGDDTI